MHNSRIKRISLAVCLALMPFAADAAGLGKLTVFSGLGEPLNAEIELTATSDEQASLSARIAPADTYTEQGLDRPAILNGLRVELGKQENGTPVIKLTSAQPVNEPFLDMLIQMEWSTGRLLREYTALLDPPGYGDQKAPADVAPPQVATAASAAPAAALPGQKSAPEQKTAKVRKPAAATAVGEAAQGKPAVQGEGYTTRSGDNLHNIAKQMQVEGVSLDQMLVGLYRGNQDAFVNGNMNRLKVGQIMRAPSSEVLQSLSPQEVEKEIRVHSSDWHAYRNKLAGAVAEGAAQEDGTQGRSESGKITALATDKAAAAAAGPRDVVKLSKSNASMAGSGSENAGASREEATARDKAIQEADARVALLEKQLQEAQKLLQLKSQTLADLQQKSPAPAAEPQPAAVPAPEPSKPATAPDEHRPDAAKKPAAPRKPAPVVAPAPGLLDDPVMTGSIGAGLLVLLGAAWFYLRNKRKKGLDSFEKGILASSGLKPNSVLGTTTGGTVDTGDTSFLTDLSQGTGGMIDTNDVDPIAEAEVYMAYGRDVQAEEILKDAIVKEPRRYELHQKLLEIYANRKDTTAFETLAGELYAALGATDAQWLKLAAMGRALEPENPLYGTGARSASQELPAAAGESPLPDVPGSAEFLPQEDGGIGIQPDEKSGAEADFAEHAAGQDNALALDFDLGFAADEEAGSPQSVAEDAALDFSFDLPESASAENVQLEMDEIGLAPETVAETREETPLTLETPSESPAMDVMPAAASEAVRDDSGFDLPELELEMETDQAADANAAAMAEPLDFMLDIPQQEASEAVVLEIAEPETETAAIDMTEIAEPDLQAAALEMSEISLDLSEDEPASVQPPAMEEAGEATTDAAVASPVPEPGSAAGEAATEPVLEEKSDLDFDFDLDLDEIPDLPSGPVASLELPDLNLSGISLDLDEPEPAPATAPADTKTDKAGKAKPQPVVEDAPVAADEPVEEITLAADESSDVDTKLDLVAAYTDMGDTEGARELLEEVLKEGGPKQRERAQAMMDSLG